MTYRHDSDVAIPLGRIIRKMSPSDLKDYPRKVHPFNVSEEQIRFNQSEVLRLISSENSSEIDNWKEWAKRPRMIAWVVSHCDTKSKREHYVDELKKHVQVDIYDKCGKPCPNQVGTMKVGN